MKTFEEIAIEKGLCVCGRFYTERGLIAPECMIHDAEDAANDFASQFKQMNKEMFIEAFVSGQAWQGAKEWHVTDGKIEAERLFNEKFNS